MWSTGVPAFWNLLGSAKKCAARATSPRSSAASQRRITRVDERLAGPVARCGTSFGTCRSLGTDCVGVVTEDPLSGDVSADFTFDEPPPHAATATAETSRATTLRRPAHMRG